MTTKEKLLARLKTDQGQWVSGEKVSNQLGISRAAIWKQINSLKKDGHRIPQTPNPKPQTPNPKPQTPFNKPLNK